MAIASAVKKEKDLLGFFDGYNNGMLEGWAYDSAVPQERLRLALSIDGKPIATMLADCYREDLETAHFQDPRHAFRFLLPAEVCDGEIHEVDIKYGNSDRSLENCPKRLCLHPIVAVYEGKIDIAEYPQVSGWAWNARNPKEVLAIELYADEIYLHTAQADIFREDLFNAGIGDGCKSFQLTLPLDILSAGKSYRIKAKVKGSDDYIDDDASLLLFVPPSPAEQSGGKTINPPVPAAGLQLNGHLDNVASSGIQGWAANLANPEIPVSVDIFSDGAFVTRATANSFRADLLQAGIGNGCHGFHAALPSAVLDGAPHEIRLYYTNTLEEVGGSPRVFQCSQNYPLQHVMEFNYFVEQCLNKAQALNLHLNHNAHLNQIAGKLDKATLYQSWWERYRLVTHQDRVAMQEYIHRMKKKPLISILMPTYNTPVDFLRQAIDSVLHQTYSNWELCIADDASTNEETLALLKEYGEKYSQIKVALRKENGHIAEATNTALEMAKGDYIAFFDHDDLLTEDALFTMAAYINRHNPDVLYSDEDKVDAKGAFYEPHFKPSFNYTLLLSCNYICHFTLIRKTIVRKIGGLRTDYNGSQDHEYLLRAIEVTNEKKILHVPYVLYHWRAHAQSTALSAGAKSYTQTAGAKAIKDHLARLKKDAEVRINKWGQYDVLWKLPRKKPKVSIIIPTRDCADVLSLCLSTLINATTYKNIEIIIINNQSVEQETFDLFEEAKKQKNVKIIDFDDAFNYSAISNLGAAHATGELLCMMNNDIEILDGHESWLEAMVGQALRPGVGAVGAKLLYPNDEVQHAGVILGVLGVAGHSHKKIHTSEPGYFYRLVVAQELSCCTAACLIMRRSVFEELKGFDEVNLPVAFNDVDLCLRVREKGYKVVFTPQALLRHHESYSRGPEDTPAKILRARKEVKYMRERWGEILDNDPYYNPNLTLQHEDFGIDLERGLEKAWAA